MAKKAVKKGKKAAEAVEIMCVLDMSGSMQLVQSDAIGGFNTFLAEQKAVPGKANFTLALFNSDGYELVHDSVAIADVPELTEKVYKPAACTPLLDAIGRTIAGLRGRCEKAGKKPKKALLAILTDGLENASKEYTKAQIMAMITEHRAEGWEVLFLAAKEDQVAEGIKLGIPVACAMAFSPGDGPVTGKGVATAYAGMSRGTTSYRKS